MSESFSILVCKFPNKYIYIVTESKQFSAKLNLLVTKISTTTKTDNKMWWAPNRHRVWYRLNNELLTLETNHKLKIDTFLVCMCFISLPVFIFCSRFSLCCLLNESALRWFGSDGSQHIFPAKKKRVTLFRTIWNTNRKLPDGKVIMRLEFNNSSIQNGQGQQQQQQRKRNSYLKEMQCDAEPNRNR